MTNKTDDQVLVARVQNGDVQAFNALVLKYEQRIINSALAYVGEAADAHDVAQETFLKAWQSIDQFRGDAAFYTWIYRIAINTAKNFITTRGRQPMQMKQMINDDGDIAENASEEYGPSDLDTPERIINAEEITQLIGKTFDKLPKEQQQALSLFELDDLEYEQIACLMNTPCGTVRSRIARARSAINAKLAPLLED